MPIITPIEVVRDWFQGDDPGASAFFVAGDDGVMLTSTNNTWTLLVYDTSSATPETAIVPDSNGTGAGTGTFFLQSATPVLDGFWTRGGTGYNWRTMVRNQDFTTIPFVAGHEYRFIWSVATPAYDGTANKIGNVTLVRRGRCMPKK